MSKDSLFTPLQLGAIQLRNRIIMAPLTRMRAEAGNMPTAMNARYYAQRASAGLIISEGTAISPDAHGYPCAPGVYTAEQIAGWRLVTEAVHARGGWMFMQIAHNGRNSHSSLRPDGSMPVAPSAVLSSHSRPHKHLPTGKMRNATGSGDGRNFGNSGHVPSGGSERNGGGI